jgi:hypothetical protein
VLLLNDCLLYISLSTQSGNFWIHSPVPCHKQKLSKFKANGNTDTTSTTFMAQIVTARVTLLTTLPRTYESKLQTMTMSRATWKIPLHTSTKSSSAEVSLQRLIKPNEVLSFKCLCMWKIKKAEYTWTLPGKPYLPPRLLGYPPKLLQSHSKSDGSETTSWRGVNGPRIFGEFYDQLRGLQLLKKHFAPLSYLKFLLATSWLGLYKTHDLLPVRLG